jgi:heme/copper-type cytochrome/quinol oxidase subunit 3
MNKNKLMMSFFVASEAFFFLALIISYVAYSHPGGTLSSSAQYLDYKRTAFFTFFLISSSVTIAIAESKLRQGKRKAMVGWMITTIVFGLIFLVGQLTEYYGLYEINITVSKNVFGSAFFTLTGFHGLHVLIGLIVLGIVLSLILKGKFKPEEKNVLETTAIYWHFVDAVWIVVFSVVYIGAII